MHIAFMAVMPFRLSAYLPSATARMGAFELRGDHVVEFARYDHAANATRISKCRSACWVAFGFGHRDVRACLASIYDHVGKSFGSFARSQPSSSDSSGSMAKRRRWSMDAISVRLAVMASLPLSSAHSTREAYRRAEPRINADGADTHWPGSIVRARRFTMSVAAVGPGRRSPPARTCAS